MLALVLAVLGPIGFPLFLMGTFLGLGPGGMERVWGYGFLIWAFAAGVAYLALAAQGHLGPGLRSAAY